MMSVINRLSQIDTVVSQLVPKKPVTYINTMNLEAPELPEIVNLNPRSIYGKVSEFEIFIQQSNVDLNFSLKPGKEKPPS